MPNEATGTLWGLPNYTGELFTADAINTPFLAMIGGLTGGQMTDNFEFVTDSEYAHEALVQSTLTENQTIAGVAPVNFVRTQNKNVVMPFMEAVISSYIKQSNGGRLSGINTAGATNNAPSERDFQISKHIESIARRVEWHFLQSTYAISTDPDTPNQTRGMIAAAALASNTTACGGAALSKELLDALFLKMFLAGALFKNPVIFVNGYQRQAITNLYSYAPEDRNIAGASIKQILTDFGNIGVAPAHRMMPTDTLLVADVAVCSPVFQPVPGKGNFFYEELAKTGAAEEGQMFGQIGLNYGPAFCHGTLTGLKDS
jgi:hypothetical protein